MILEVSVIITAYNVEKYISRAIQSALNQIDVDVEIIVIDDASTDNTPSIIKSFNDERVISLSLSENGGPSAARNAAIERATKPWLAVLDGDDYFLPLRLKNCLARARVIDADVIVDNITVHHEIDGREAPMFVSSEFSRNTMLTLATFISKNSSFLGGPHTLGYLKPIFSKAFLDKHALRYNQSLRIGEDYLLMCEVLASGAKCAIEPSAEYVYTVRPHSISYRLSPVDVECMIDQDKHWLSRYPLGLAATKAQRGRTRALEEALAFSRLIQALKGRDFFRALQALKGRPLAVFQLWRPVVAKFQRTIVRIAPKTRT